MIGILERIFGCSHEKTTFPISRTRMSAVKVDGRPVPYVVCLDCGREFDYDWQAMRIGKPTPARHFTMGSPEPEKVAALNPFGTGQATIVRQ